jgi:phage FluMu protein gp41
MPKDRIDNEKKDSVANGTESNNSESGDRKDLPRVWYIGLIVLSIISLLGIVTVFLLALIVPSEIELEIKKAGMTVTIIGGVGLFLVLLRMYLNAYTIIVKLLLTILGAWVIVASSITLYDFSKYDFSGEIFSITALRKEKDYDSFRKYLYPRVPSSVSSDYHLKARNSRSLLYGWLGERRRAILALEIIGTNGTVPLINALNHADLNVRESAIWALGEIEDPIAVKPLLKLTQDSNHNIRAGAAESLGKIKGPIAVEALIKALDDPDSCVREAAISALLALKDKNNEALKALEKIGMGHIPDILGPGLNRNKERASHNHTP